MEAKRDPQATSEEESLGYSSDEERDIATAPETSNGAVEDGEQVIVISPRMRRWLLRMAQKSNGYRNFTDQWFFDRALNTKPLLLKEYCELKGYCDFGRPEACQRGIFSETLQTEMLLMKTHTIDASEWEMSAESGLETVKRLLNEANDEYGCALSGERIITFSDGSEMHKWLCTLPAATPPLPEKLNNTLANILDKREQMTVKIYLDLRYHNTPSIFTQLWPNTATKPWRRELSALGCRLK